VRDLPDGGLDGSPANHGMHRGLPGLRPKPRPALAGAKLPPQRRPYLGGRQGRVVPALSENPLLPQVEKVGAVPPEAGYRASIDSSALRLSRSRKIEATASTFPFRR
jgi:hypothetical protein